jgi:hypothetical protein
MNQIPATRREMGPGTFLLSQKSSLDFPGFNGHLWVVVETWEGLWGISADRSLSD